MKVEIDGRVFQGTPKQIVKAMQDVAFDARALSYLEYIAWVAENTQRLNGVAVQVSGETDDERAASLLEELIREGLARPV